MTRVTDGSKPGRNRLVCGALLGATVGAGLASRSRWAAGLPDFWRDYSGDTLWAVALFLGLAVVFPRAGTVRIALATLLLAWGVEFSQFYQADWINRVRQTRVGGLILGFGFLGSDLVCYTVGVGVAAGVDGLLRRRRPSPETEAGPR